MPAKTDPITNNSQWTAGFKYDVNGKLIRSTDAKGVNIINEYDNADRVLKRCYSKANIVTTATTCAALGSNIDPDTPTVTYKYDLIPNGKGALIETSNGISTSKTTQIDQWGRPTQYQQITDVGTAANPDFQTYTSSYQYNLSGAMTQETYPSGRVVKNTFDSNGDLARIHGTATPSATERTYANSFNYLPDGRIERLKIGNGLWEKAKFNDRLQVTEFGLGRGADNMNLWKINLEYGELQTNGTVDTSKNTGNLAKQTISFEGLAQPFVQTYKYDSLYRLTEAKETNNNNQNWIQNFDYDRYGNRTTVSEDIAGKAPFVVNNITHPTIDQATNRFNPNQGYLYDKVGNLTRDVTPSHSRQITFDGNNKQTKIENVDSQGNPIGAVGEYFYDGGGKRVKKVIYDSIGVHKETVIFVYSNGKLVEEFSTIPPQPSEADTKYVATDHLQSVRAISNQDGEIASRRDFLPFGEELPSETNLRKSEYKYASSEDTIRQKFTGYESDSESGLDYAQARMYNNQHARFTAVDPLLASGKSGNPQTFNRYVYVINSPLQYTDPDGLQVATEVGRIVGGILAQVVVDGGFEKYEWDSKKWQLNPILPNNYEGGDIHRDAQLFRSQQYYNRLQSLNQESVISDGESIEIGLKRFINRPFQLPISSFGGQHTMSMNPLTTPTISDLTGFQPFSDSETSTVTLRDEVIAFGTEFTLDAILTRGAGKFGGVSRGSSSLRMNFNGLSSPERSIGREFLKNVGNNTGNYKVVAHGNSREIFVNNKPINANKFSVQLNGTSYAGETLKLFCCRTGARTNGFAQKLANRKGKRVDAPTDNVVIGTDGSFYVENGGRFTSFFPKPKN